MATKKVRQLIFCPLLFVVVDSGIRDGKSSGSGIWVKHPGSATLNKLFLIHDTLGLTVFFG
jgi:hypothetical protein